MNRWYCSEVHDCIKRVVRKEIGRLKLNTALGRGGGTLSAFALCFENIVFFIHTAFSATL